MDKLIAYWPPLLLGILVLLQTLLLPDLLPAWAGVLLLTLAWSVAVAWRAR